MTGFKPRTHQREVAGMPYTVLTANHARGVAISVTVPGMGSEEQANRTYATEAQALRAADGIARALMQQCAVLDATD